MKTIWKYELETGCADLVMPAGAEILSMQLQAGKPVLWALVDPDQPPDAPRTFHIYGTGQNLDDQTSAESFVATFQVGVLVFHVFEAS